MARRLLFLVILADLCLTPLAARASFDEPEGDFPDLFGEEAGGWWQDLPGVDIDDAPPTEPAPMGTARAAAADEEPSHDAPEGPSP